MAKKNIEVKLPKNGKDSVEKQLAQREAELAIINSVGEAMSKQLDIQTVTKIVGDKVKEIFQTEVTEILLVNHDTGIIEIPFSFYNGYRIYEPFKLGEGLTSSVISSRKPLLLHTLDEQIKNGALIQSEEDKTESYMGVPILFGDTVLGVVSIQSYTANMFDENSVRLLLTLSNSMGIALQNARLFEKTDKLLKDTEQRSAELAIINSVGEAMSKQLDVITVTKIVGDKVREIFSSQVTEILLINEEGTMIEVPYSYYNGYQTVEPFELGAGLTSKVINSGKHLMLNSLSDQNYYGAIVDDNVGDADLTESYLGVPIMFNDKILGVVSIQSYNKDAYDENDIRLLTTLSTNMGVTLQNAKLFEETKRLLKETEQRSAELAVINSVQDGLAKELDMNGIYQLVGERLCELFHLQTLVIRTFDYETEYEHWQFAVEEGEKQFVKPRPFNWNSKILIETKKPLYIRENYVETAKKYGSPGVTSGQPPKSAVFVPMIVGDIVKGSVSLQNVEKENAFNDSDLRLLTTITNSMVVAIENARLFDETNRLLNETEQRNVELSILNTIQEGLVMEMDFEAIIKLVGDKFREALGFQDLGIRIYDKEKNILHFPYEYEHGEKLTIESMEPTPFSKYVIETGKMLLMRQNTDEEAARIGVTGQVTIPGTDRSKSLIMVPIILGSDVKGLILIENYEKEDAFSESDIRLLITIANSMSVALENARLFKETLRLLDESKKFTAELSTVNSISQAIAGHLEINKLINLVGDKVRILFNANIVYLALLDKERNMIDFPYGFGEDFPPLKYGDGLTSKIIISKEPLLLNTEVDKKTEELGVKRIGVPSASYLGVPIPVGDEIIGVLSVQSTARENVFTRDDMRLLGTIAAHVGIAINNANAYKELNKTLVDLQATQNQLIAQEKLASLGQLTAGIAHEIKNPLNFVNNFSELSVGLVEELREELNKLQTKIDKEDLEEINELLDALNQNAEKTKEHGKRADSIVHSMLQHSRGKTGEKQLTDINSMLDEDLNLVYHGMRAQDGTFNIKIEREYEKSLSKVEVIPQDMSRVFLNILTNGCYEAHRKKIELNGEEPAKIKVKTLETVSHIEVRIRDNGHGIPEKIRGSLFTPFFTTKPTGKGTGLGLSISYDIVVAEHKGELLFETEEGEFTEFIIKLPKNSKK